MITEKEAVMRERAAAHWGWAIYSPPRDNSCFATACEKRFPMPRVTRPRVVTDRDGYTFRVEGGEVQYRGTGASWYQVGLNNSISVNQERIRLWADLLNSPLETVEEES